MIYKYADLMGCRNLGVDCYCTEAGEDLSAYLLVEAGGQIRHLGHGSLGVGSRSHGGTLDLSTIWKAKSRVIVHPHSQVAGEVYLLVASRLLPSDGRLIEGFGMGGCKGRF